MSAQRHHLRPSALSTRKLLSSGAEVTTYPSSQRSAILLSQPVRDPQFKQGAPGSVSQLLTNEPFLYSCPKTYCHADANATSGQIKMSLKMSNNYLKAVAMKQKLNTGQRICVKKRFTWIVKVKNMYTCVCVYLTEKYPPKRALTVALIAYIWQWEWKFTFSWVFFFILLHKWLSFFQTSVSKKGRDIHQC